MSWEIIKLADGAGAARTAGETVFAVSYLLRGDPASDTAVDPAGALANILTPRIGDSYGTTAPRAHCVALNPSCLGNGWEYLITATYSDAAPPAGRIDIVPGDGSVDPTSPQYIGGGFPINYDPTDATQQGAAVDVDPTRLPWTFEQSSRSMLIERPKLYTVTDAGAVTATLADTAILTNGKPLAQVVTEDVSLPVLQLSKNVPDAFITPLDAAYIVGSVNSAAVTIAGIALLARQAMIIDLRLRRNWYGEDKTPFWELALSVAIFDGTERSDIWVLQQDYYEIDGAGPGVKTIDIAGSATFRPVAIGADGKVTLTPYHKKFARTNIRSWAALALPRKV
jgi:hypothetical protein